MITSHKVAQMKFIRTLGALLLLTLCFCISVQSAEPDARLSKKYSALLNKYCLECHDSDTKKGKVDLEKLSLKISTVQQAELWQKVLNSMNSGEMPPENKPQPENIEKADFLDSLAKTMVMARKTLGDSKGKITMRRLNRREYQNTINDLLGVKINVRDLPDESGAGSFDTVGSSLFMSSDQFEQYLVLGRKALDEHFARMTPAGTPKATKSYKIHIEPETQANKKATQSIASAEDSLKRFKQWTSAVDILAALPKNADIAKEIRALPVVKARPRAFYQEWAKRMSEPVIQKFGFGSADGAEFQRGQYRKSQYSKDYLSLPNKDNGAYLTVFHLLPLQKISAKASWPTGTYILRVRIGALPDAPKDRRFIQFGVTDPNNPNVSPTSFSLLSTHQITGTVDKPQILEIPVNITLDSNRTFALREKFDIKTAGYDMWINTLHKTGTGPKPALWIDWLELKSLSKTKNTIEKTKKTKLHKTRNDPEQWANKYMPIYARGYEEKYKRFMNWCTEIDKAAAMPENAEEAAKLREDQRLKTQPHLFYNGFTKISGAPAPTKFGFKDVDAAQFARTEYQYHHQYYADYQKLPQREEGAWLMLYSLGRYARVSASEKWPAGKYTLRIRLAASDQAPKDRRFIEIGTGKADASDFNVISSHQVTGTLKDPQILEVSVNINESGPRNFAIRDRRPNTRTAEYDMFREAWDKTGTGPVPCIWIDYVELEGPQSGQNNDWWLLPEKGLSEKDRARKILQRFATLAFRGLAPSSDYLDRLTPIFEDRRAAGDSFDLAIREPLSAILASPGFLYLNEPGKEGKPRSLNGRELATRLSYFLWSAPPDQQLLTLAKSGELAKPQVLSQQVNRMLDSPKSREFVEGFVHQWLEMERLNFFQFDSKQHRDFDESAKAASRQEVYESVAYILQKNGNLGQLLKSDYVVINGLLATYYGIKGISGDEFRRVKLPANSPRGGLLGMAAILAMGSNGIETSPIERGAWVLRHLLHDPPPPAPANVPQISRFQDKPLTTRERFAAHTEKAQCVSCHRKIDPIGFGLENFNATGKWRTTNQHRDKRGKILKEWKIDPSGSFYKGPRFADYFELRDLIVQRQEDFARGFIEALIEYALGRPFGFSDENFADELLQQARKSGFVMREFVQGLVLSEAFLSK